MIYEVKFIDSVRFMPRYTISVPYDLAVGIGKYKYKDCTIKCLQYMEENCKTKYKDSKLSWIYRK